MEAKAQKLWPRGENLQNPWVLHFLNEGGEFWVERNSPSLVFMFPGAGVLAQASSARPSELTPFFFFFFGRQGGALAPTYP